MSIFKPRTDFKKAIVFVDYEYWFYSYKNQYSMRPNLTAWRRALEEQYRIVDIMIFADFNSPIGEDLARIRSITNTIIETGTANQQRKKDMTDFVMLDYIYQSVTDREDVGTDVIFPGDGHVQSVIKYLIQTCRKNVVVYGVESTFSTRLSAVATNVVLLPSREDLDDCYAQMIIKNFARIESKRNVIPTFWDTIEFVARQNNVPQDAVKSVMLKLISNEYVHQKEVASGRREDVRILVPDWDRMRRDGLYDYQQ